MIGYEFEFLVREGAAKKEEATRIALAAGGRPGFALSLALGDGGEAIAAIIGIFEVSKGDK